MKIVTLILFLFFFLYGQNLPLIEVKRPIYDENKIQMTKDQLIDLITGFIQGFHLGDEFYDIFDCLDADVWQVVPLFQQAMGYLRDVDLRHLQYVADAMELLVEGVYDILKNFEPCIKDVRELDEILLEILTVNIFEITFRILRYGGQMLTDLKALPIDWAKENYKQYGHDLGDLFYLILL